MKSTKIQKDRYTKITMAYAYEEHYNKHACDAYIIMSIIIKSSAK